jgi:two-component system OmpR family response regulator
MPHNGHSLATDGSNMHVLLVEDDAVLADGLSRMLEGHGMQVEVLGNGSLADQVLQRSEAAVAVLDIGLPGIDGFEVVRRLRARGSALPVLLLTARDAVEDRVRGLETGADDYLVKPFATAELVARIKALARRNAPPPALLAFGALRLDTGARRARIGERIIDLSVREWAVLEYLLQHAGRVVSKQQIIDAILPWGEDVTLNAVEVYISRLRLKIADAGVTIRTIRGFGYMLEQTPPAP